MTQSFIVEASSLEGPIALAVHSKTAARDSGLRCADIAEWLEAHNQQTLDICQKLRRTTIPFFEFNVTVQDAHFIDAVVPPNVVKEPSFVVAS